jgi:hypothetical protein
MEWMECVGGGRERSPGCPLSLSLCNDTRSEKWKVFAVYKTPGGGALIDGLADAHQTAGWREDPHHRRRGQRIINFPRLLFTENI